MSRYRKYVALLLSVVLLASFTACAPRTEEQTGDQTKESFVPEDTTSLVIYDAPALTELLQNAIHLFQAEYPGVEVDFRRFDSVDNWDIATYETMLNSELAAGEGPDIVLSESDYININTFKSMETGVYADIDPFLIWDETFEMADYNEVVLNAGIYQGKRYAVPISFKSNIWITTQEVLDEAGMEIESGLQDFVPTMETLVDYKLENPEKWLFFGLFAGLGLKELCPWCGLQPVNIEDRSITLDTDEFHSLINAYKDIFYVESMVNPPTVVYPNNGFPLINREAMFVRVESLYNILSAYSALKTTQTPLLVNSPSFNDKVIGVPNIIAFIREGSPNQLNAYRFLKILLSEEIQSDTSIMTNVELPVLRESITVKIKNMLSKYCVRGGITEGGILEFSSLSSEEINMIIDTIYNIDVCTLDPTIDDLWLGMLPYITGEDTYENCLAETTAKLTLILNE